MNHPITRAIAAQILLVVSLACIFAGSYYFAGSVVGAMLVTLAVAGLVRLDDTLIRRRRAAAVTA